mmetsp:Transcript_10413/g.21422  ORF Transcript_10413/g.21422 Transcript_10413/m.21422 type:complete len:248 (-) Transcript_10413:11-754(-)
MMSDIETTIISGSLAGFVSTLLVYPLDLIRTKKQSLSLHPRPPTTLQILRPLLSHPPSLYTGITVPLLSQVVYKSTIFTTVGVLNKHLGDHPFVNGCIAGGVNALLFVTPTEYIRNNVIVNELKLGDFRRMKFCTVYRGATWSVCRDVLGCGGFFGSDRYVKVLYPDAPSYVRGGIAGVCFWILALPLDSIKTLIQVEKKSRVEVYRSIKRNPGRLFNSWGVAFARGVPGAASTIAVYEWTKEWMEG